VLHASCVFLRQRWETLCHTHDPPPSSSPWGDLDRPCDVHTHTHTRRNGHRQTHTCDVRWLLCLNGFYFIFGTPWCSNEKVNTLSFSVNNVSEAGKKRRRLQKSAFWKVNTTASVPFPLYHDVASFFSRSSLSRATPQNWIYKTPFTTLFCFSFYHYYTSPPLSHDRRWANAFYTHLTVMKAGERGRRINSNCDSQWCSSFRWACSPSASVFPCTFSYWVLR
jgi:hypothetical protein